MTLVLGTLDWVVVLTLVLIVSGVALAAAIVLSRRHADQELLGVRSQLRLLEQRLAGLERQKPVAQLTPPLAVPVHRPPPALPERPEWNPPAAQPPAVERTVDTLTRDAAAALTSLKAYQAFAQAEGGSGFVVGPGSQSCQPVIGNDPVSASDVWAVPFEDGHLYFPGWNLRRTQSALLADAGRSARDRLGWLFEIVAGEQLAASRPAYQRSGEQLERGLLTMPLAR